jgi:hypothetical protein
MLSKEQQYRIEWEDIFIRLVYPEFTTIEIAEHLGKAKQTIAARCNKLNLKKLWCGYRIKPGQKFGRWKVICINKNLGRKNRILCICNCKNRTMRYVLSSFLLNGKSKSCGCIAIDTLSKRYGNIIGQVFSRIVASAKDRNLEININMKYISSLFDKQNGKCAISGIGISLPENTKEFREGDCTASLDRIDSKKGYIIGNVQWVHKRVNFMKQDMNENDFIEFCHIISNYQRIKYE